MSEIALRYTYPDGLGTGGTFTDGDQFSEESIQTIIDGVVAHTRSDEQQRIIKLLEERLRVVIAVGTDEKTWYWIDGMNDAIALIKGENK